MKRKWMAALLVLTLIMGGFAMAEQPEQDGAPWETVREDAPQQQEEAQEEPKPEEAKPEEKQQAAVETAQEPVAQTALEDAAVAPEAVQSEPEDAPPEPEQPQAEPEEVQPELEEAGADPLGGELLPEDAEPEAEPERQPVDLETLSFWQDGTVMLSYNWDEDGQCWMAQPLDEVRVPIYVKNEGDQAALVRVLAEADQRRDGGGCYLLRCELLPAADGLSIEPGQSVHIADYVFSGEGGSSAMASQDTLYIGLSVQEMNQV